MKKRNQNISLLAIAIVVTMAIGFTGCKSKKNVAAITTEQESDPVIEDTEMDKPDEETETIKETPVKTATKQEQLSNYFKAIATAPSTASANASIQEALTMFGTSEAPILIVIYRAGSKPDYDEPTTIVKYLNYLKDTKNNKAQVEEIVYDTNGKIKELVLKK
ncbi:nucleoid-structuring protein H-NS [Reichenbachiella sp. MALMAid0571]|uniref:nucleoid-structuring protein H-NS n=1 Tax=Reichenbachiella sp. MALMAid0571 TaxID=3143939 RepID=UPI0032DE6DDE